MLALSPFCTAVKRAIQEERPEANPNHNLSCGRMTGKPDRTRNWGNFG
jgi:hypothetical protein